MVQCAAFNCTVNSGKGISMFLFPKDANLRKTWVMKMKREGFEPTRYSKLCEKHFEKDQFIDNSDLYESIGFAYTSRKKLRETAIPSLFDFGPTTSTPLKRSGQTQRTSKACEKRQRLQTIDEILMTGDSTEQHLDDKNKHDAETLPSETDEGVRDTYSCATQTSYFLVKRRHVAIQTNIADYCPNLIDQATQTEPVSDFLHKDEEVESELDTSFGSFRDDVDDLDWEPDHDDNVMNCDGYRNPASERKFIVYESCLDRLLSSCSKCGNPCDVSKTVIGTFVKVKTLCNMCCNPSSWESQPLSRTMPFGNLVIAAAILFSGNSPSQALTMYRHACIAMISLATYMKIQRLYLVPTISSVWQNHQQVNLAKVRDGRNPVVVGGDGRCCSPGHTAKYLTYSLMDMDNSKILDIQLVQCNEVKNSYAMELEGLKRCLDKLEGAQVEISDLVTDRHCQIKKFIKEQHPNIKHWFDCWHVAKGVFKKLEATGKKKSCEVLGGWAHSISNHIYWCAMSSGGDGRLVVEKWLSILNHVINIHHGHGENFVECQHDTLDDRAWLKKDSAAFSSLEKIVKSRILLTDIPKLSPGQQTSGLEAFHKVICHFAPKLVHFFHAQMESRVYLAALHFNENSQREQAVNKDDQARFAISYPKARKGEGVAKEVKVQVTYDYIAVLFEELLHFREMNSSFTKAREANFVAGKERPLPLSQTCNHPLSKDEIVASHKSRFNK